MERKADVARDRVYQDFEPVTRWVSEPGLDILLVTLPGFRKEQLKVQVTTTRRLRLLGERPAGGNKWIRFRKEFPIQGNIDAEAIAAKFEDGTLAVKHPRYKPHEPETQTKPPVQHPPMGTADQQPQTQEAVAQKPMIEHPETNPLKPATGSQKAEEEKFTDTETNKAKKASKEAEKYKDKVVGMVKEAQNKKQVIMNLVAAILVVLLLVLYARNAVRSSIEILDE